MVVIEIMKKSKNFILNFKIIFTYKLFRSSSDEATEPQPAKLDFKQLLNKFEKPQQQEAPPLNTYKKRSSIQVTSISTLTSSSNTSMLL